MSEYHFRLILQASRTEPLTDEELLDATDALGDAGCNDCSISSRGCGLELAFEREQRTLQDALASAIRDVEKAGFEIAFIEMDRNAVPPVGAS